MDERTFYEQLAPLAARQLNDLRNAPEDELARLVFDAVDVVEDEGHGTHIAVVFRDPARPECRFGWRWSWVEGPRPEELEFAASVLVVNLEEDVLAEGYGLPETCSEGEVSWL